MAKSNSIDIRVSRRVLKRMDDAKIPYIVTSKSGSGFVYVPSLGFDVARYGSHYGLNWNQKHDALAQENSEMITLPEFVEFLKYVKGNHELSGIYHEIMDVDSPTGESFDAYFEQRRDGMYVLTQNKTKAEKLSESTLMEHRTQGISIESWLKNSTPQGLPKKIVKKGKSSYFAPQDGKVASFRAGSVGLYCGGGPWLPYTDLKVRAVKRQ